MTHDNIDLNEIILVGKIVTLWDRACVKANLVGHLETNLSD